MKFESERVFGFLKAVFLVLLFGGVTYGGMLLINMSTIATYAIGGYFCALVLLITAADIRSMFDKTKYHEYDEEVVDCWENVLKMDYLRYVAFDFHKLYWKQMMNILSGLWCMVTSFAASIKELVLCFKNLLLFTWLLFSSIIGLRFFYNIIEAKKYSELSKKSEKKFEEDIVNAWNKGGYRGNPSKTWKGAYKSARGGDKTKILNEFMVATHIRRNVPLYDRIVWAITK